MYKISVCLNLIMYCIQVISTAKKQAKKNKDQEEYFASESDEDAYSDDDCYISEYERAALKRKEENQQLMKELQIYRVSAV